MFQAIYKENVNRAKVQGCVRDTLLCAIKYWVFEAVLDIIIVLCATLVYFSVIYSLCLVYIDAWP